MTPLPPANLEPHTSFLIHPVSPSPNFPEEMATRQAQKVVGVRDGGWQGWWIPSLSKVMVQSINFVCFRQMWNHRLATPGTNWVSPSEPQLLSSHMGQE